MKPKHLRKLLSRKKLALPAAFFLSVSACSQFESAVRVRWPAPLGAEPPMPTQPVHPVPPPSSYELVRR